MAARALRVALATLGTIGVALAIVATRVVVESERALERGDALMRAGDEDRAAIQLGEAVRWYAPSSPHPRRALALLMELAERADERGERDVALSRYRRVRSSILSVRSVWTPFETELRAADARIADLMARTPPAAADSERPFEARRAAFARELRDAVEADPHPVWVVLLLVGFALWVGASFGFAALAIDADDRLLPARARFWGALVALGLAMWIAGMALA